MPANSNRNLNDRKKQTYYNWLIDHGVLMRNIETREGNNPELESRQYKTIEEAE